MSLLNFGAGDKALRGDIEQQTRPSEADEIADPKQRSGLFGFCANRGCRSSWLHLFRSRTRPVFEGGWTCSPACTEERIRMAVHRETEGWSQMPEPYRHRVPLGLLMLEQGMVSSSELRRALEAQRRTAKHRIGEWLMQQGAAEEASVTRALSVQWGCPVLPLRERKWISCAGVIPRLFLEAFKVVPVRTGGDKLLYLGFEERRDAVLALGVERMAGVRVESGIVPSSEFRDATERLLSGSFPSVQFVEAVSAWAAAHAMARSIERFQPLDARLVRVRSWLWLRMFLGRGNSVSPDAESVRDVICTIGSLNSRNLFPGR